MDIDKIDYFSNKIFSIVFVTAVLSPIIIALTIYSMIEVIWLTLLWFIWATITVIGSSLFIYLEIKRVLLWLKRNQ